jgi:hypothetical protein
LVEITSLLNRADHGQVTYKLPRLNKLGQALKYQSMGETF